MSQLVHELVASQAEQTPNAVAVRIAGASITFGELERQANQIARVLRDHGCKRGDRVAVVAPMTPNAITALLGVLKADAIFVPLHAAQTPATLARIVAECQPACLLTAAATAPVVDAIADAGAIAGVVGSLERGPIAGRRFVTAFSLAEAEQASGRAVASRNRTANPATLVFKSGAPSRGVVTTHAALARSVAWAMTQFDVTPGSRHAIAPDLAGDRALFAVVTALAGGAELVPVAWEAKRPWQLVDSLRRSKVTHWYTTGADLASAATADVVLPADLPALRQVMWWTDVVLPGAIHYWTRRLSHVRFTSLYGAPEAATVSAHQTWRDEPAAIPDVPIGVARPGQDVVILNDDREPVPAGGTGEVWIKGLGLSPGYWGDPGGTAEVFRREGLDAAGRDRMWRTGDRGRLGPDGSLYLTAASDSGASVPGGAD
jgi:non-ribosomal peptide synthetase component F